MGLLDMLFGQQGGMDATGMGPPAPATGGLLSNAFGGPQIDPAIAAQIGVDPEKIRHQQMQQNLMNLAAGLLAPTQGHRASFGEALGHGIQSMQQGQQSQMPDLLRQAYQSQQLSGMKAQQQSQADAQARADALRKSISGGALGQGLAGLPPEILSAMDPNDVVRLGVSQNTADAADRRQATRDQAAADRQAAQFAESEKNATLRARIAAGAAGEKMPPGFNQMSDAQKQAYLNKLAGLPVTGDGTTPPLTKAQQAAAEKRAADIQAQLTSIDNADLVGSKIEQGFGDGSYDSTGINHLRNAWFKDTPFAQSTGGQKLTTDGTDYALAMQAAMSAPGNRGSVQQLKMLGVSKPNNANDLTANQHSIETNRQLLAQKRAALQAELEHLNNGGAVTTFTHPVASAQGASVPGNVRQDGAPAGGMDPAMRAAIMAELQRRQALGQ